MAENASRAAQGTDSLAAADAQPSAPVRSREDLDAAAWRAAMERAAAICLEQAAVFRSPEYAAAQPLSSFAERFACDACATAIRNEPFPSQPEVA